MIALVSFVLDHHTAVFWTLLGIAAALWAYALAPSRKDRDR